MQYWNYNPLSIDIQQCQCWLFHIFIFTVVLNTPSYTGDDGFWRLSSLSPRPPPPCSWDGEKLQQGPFGPRSPESYHVEPQILWVVDGGSGALAPGLYSLPPHGKGEGVRGERVLLQSHLLPHPAGKGTLGRAHELLHSRAVYEGGRCWLAAVHAVEERI